MAIELGKFPEEVEAQTTKRGLFEWVAFRKLRAEREAAAHEEARREAEARR